MSQLIFKLHNAFLDMPKEVLAAIWRLILTLIIGTLYLLKFLLERLRFKEKCKTTEWPRVPSGCKVPEQVKRKPDPCIYSQFYRMSQGLSVTWNNPDIIIDEPGVGPVQSSQLQSDKDYIVRAKISNAASDPALATEVRCYYRPWSFNSPDLVPVELNPDGTEKVDVVHIFPWGHDTASFKWHTPPDPGHYCIRVECQHPDDKNPNNNVGQENTNVVAAAAGDNVEMSPMLFNLTDREMHVRIFVDQFQMPHGDITLHLKKKRFSLVGHHFADSLHRAMLVTDPITGKLRYQRNAVPYITRYTYTGWDKLIESMKRGRHPITIVQNLRVDGAAIENGWATTTLSPKSSKAIPIKFNLPATAASGDTKFINFTAITQLGKVIGGVTVNIRVI